MLIAARIMWCSGRAWPVADARANVAASAHSITAVITIGPTAPCAEQRGDRRRRARPRIAAAGSVSSQAVTMLPATPQRTAEKRLAAPAPMIAAGDHVRGRERVAEVGGGEDHRGAGALRGEALRGVHLDDPRAHAS